MVLMEAMASGLPVVTTMVGGISELVEHEVNGLLLRPGDPTDLAEALARMAADHELRAAYGRAGTEKVAAEFRSAEEAARLGRLIVEQARGLPSETRPAGSLPADG